jgi:hypothetical protein
MFIMLGLFILLAGVTAPVRKADQPYAVAIAPDGRMQFQLPLGALVLPAQAITALARTTYTGSEGGQTQWLEISAVPRRRLSIDATWNRPEVERLIAALAPMTTGVVVEGAWLRE